MPGCSQKEFIQRIRQSIAAANLAEHPVDLPDDLSAARVADAGTDAVELFLTRAGEAKMVPVRVPDAAGMVSRVLALCKEADARTAVVPEEAFAGRDELLAGLRAAGMELLNANDRDMNFKADVGITGAELGVAETGSILLNSGGPRRRLSSLAVPIHVALLPALRIVPDLLDWPTQLPSELPSGMVLVSGPSKTADIELSLVMGVHGPRDQHVIVVG